MHDSSQAQDRSHEVGDDPGSTPEGGKHTCPSALDKAGGHRIDGTSAGNEHHDQ
ncbi:hypothetical protein SDC9_136990 [bioreactor metagenome]|uniref:Uncharacterized protein n=1 Tax=bioreactor metagenome TaxID=1076179 RepID=A0A645DKS5_9ZZZZ